MIKVISVKENPAYKDIAIAYLQKIWEEMPPVIYEDCVSHCVNAKSDLPQWYLLENDGEVVGCAGLVPNDFISRMDLYPWVCAVFVDERYRGNSYGSLLLEKAKEDTKKAGFQHMYLCTDHIGYYERYGFKYIGQGYHPWEEESRIYGIEV
jgi:N-acetylglutamate synthase-like GNAT family acetyltransferase